MFEYKENKALEDLEVLDIIDEHGNDRGYLRCLGDVWIITSINLFYGLNSNELRQIADKLDELNAKGGE